MTSPTILIVDDEIEILNLVSYNLKQESMNVYDTQNGQDAIKIMESNCVDLAILDWMLPDISGIELCKHIRQNNHSFIPIIMLTARNHENDRITGFESGADDYLGKPFSIKELMMRVHALLRRSKTDHHVCENLTYHDIDLNTKNHRVMKNGQKIHLAPTEFRLLKHFMQYPQQVFSRKEILKAVWGDQIYVEDRTVDVHIRRLRKALNQTGDKSFIRTVRSSGYALDHHD